MEEEKKVNAPEGNGGHRRRRHRHHGKKRPNGENGQAQQNAQTAVQKQANGQPKQGQKQGNPQGQNAQKPQNGQNGQNKQKNAQNGQNRDREREREREKEREREREKNRQKQDENRKDTYVYTLDGNLYINLTNKCSNGCDFCVRNERSSYYGNYLWLRHGEPTAEKVIAAIHSFGDLKKYKEVVFCGFGEPTYRVAEMVAVADYAHEKGLKTRLNTNGQGNLINKRDIVPELKGHIDFVNISLNASCVEKYQPICRSMFGENGFAALIEFARICRREGVNCRFSIVDCIGEEEVEACKKLAASVSVPLYVRKYIIDS